MLDKQMFNVLSIQLSHHILPVSKIEKRRRNLTFILFKIFRLGLKLIFT